MKGVAAAVGIGCLAGMWLGHTLMPVETPLPEVNQAPYCMVDTETPNYLAVAGPAEGVITVNGVERGTLVLVDDDVADEAGPFDGILFNVPGPGVVAVDGIGCEST